MDLSELNIQSNAKIICIWKNVSRMFTMMAKNTIQNSISLRVSHSFILIFSVFLMSISLRVQFVAERGIIIARRGGIIITQWQRFISASSMQNITYVAREDLYLSV